MTLLLDVLLHWWQLAWIGRYLGIAGTLLITLSFTYSIVKRKVLRFLPPKQMLRWHEVLAWIGSLAVLLHAGKHFNAFLPWLATISMLISVGSGLVGGYLLRRARTTVKIRKQTLSDDGKTQAEIEKQMFLDLLTVRTLSKWRKIHMPITVIFFTTSLYHIASIFIFWSWR